MLGTELSVSARRYQKTRVLLLRARPSSAAFVAAAASGIIFKITCSESNQSTRRQRLLAPHYCETASTMHCCCTLFLHKRLVARPHTTIRGFAENMVGLHSFLVVYFLHKKTIPTHEKIFAVGKKVAKLPLLTYFFFLG